MGYALRPGVSFCLVGDRVLFLDVPRDRYLCLGRELEQHFLRLVAGNPVEAEEVQRLTDLRFIVPVPDAGLPRPCAPPRRAEKSLLDATGRTPATKSLDLVRAFCALGSTSANLRLFGLASMLAGFRRHKARRKAAPGRQPRVDATIKAFEDTRFLLTAQDRCLVRSVAISRRLLAAGAAPDLILAVKLQPFRAHCWVQLDDMLVNDRHDFVRDYTPILVL